MISGVVKQRFIPYNASMKRILIWILCLTLLVGCAYDPTESEDTRKLDLYAFSVGKADALLIRTDDAAIMIDTGENGDGEELVAHLLMLGIDRLDLLILTHYDKDHIGGADALIENLPIGRIILPDYEKDSKQYRQLADALERTAAEVTYLNADESLTFGELLLSVWVSPVLFDGKSDNEQSLITKVIYGGRTYLFMGDAEDEELKKLIFSGRNLTCDVLKLPHHGDPKSMTAPLLQKLSPSVAVISCQSDPRGGKDRPNEQVVAMLQSSVPHVFCTENRPLKTLEASTHNGVRVTVGDDGTIACETE